MRLRFSNGARIAATALAVASAASVLPAQERQAPAPGAPISPPDAIAGARKDFEAITAAREAAWQPKADLPRLSVPDWPGSTPAPLIAAPSAKLPAREPQSANWLLDAMERSEGSSDARRAKTLRAHPRDSKERDAATNPRDSRSPNAATASDAHQPGETADDDREARAEKKRNDEAAVINPLRRYLGDWMTPQDYALLQPDVGGPRAGESPSSRDGTPAGTPSPASAFTLPGIETAFGLVPPTPRVSAASPPRENPFLQSLPGPEIVAVAGSAKSASFSAPSAPAPAPGATILPPPPQPPNPTKLPEFANPLNDEKYFKQLKRF